MEAGRVERGPNVGQPADERGVGPRAAVAADRKRAAVERTGEPGDERRLPEEAEHVRRQQLVGRRVRVELVLLLEGRHLGQEELRQAPAAGARAEARRWNLIRGLEAARRRQAVVARTPNARRRRRALPARTVDRGCRYLNARAGLAQRVGRRLGRAGPAPVMEQQLGETARRARVQGARNGRKPRAEGVMLMLLLFIVLIAVGHFGRLLSLRDSLRRLGATIILARWFLGAQIAHLSRRGFFFRLIKL